MLHTKTAFININFETFLAMLFNSTTFEIQKIMQEFTYCKSIFLHTYSQEFKDYRFNSPFPDPCNPPRRHTYISHSFLNMDIFT